MYLYRRRRTFGAMTSPRTLFDSEYLPSTLPMPQPSSQPPHSQPLTEDTLEQIEQQPDVALPHDEARLRRESLPLQPAPPESTTQPSSKYSFEIESIQPPLRWSGDRERLRHGG